MSSHSRTNHSDNQDTNEMSSSQIPETPYSQTSTDATDPPKTLESQTPSQESSDRTPADGDEETLKGQEEEETNLEGEETLKGQEEEESNLEVEAEDEGEGECGFCVFMKGGGCKETFIDWENCIEEGEKNNEDIVEKCFQVTAALKKCMEAHPDYYEPILRAEQAAEAEAVKELEKEKEKEKEKESLGSEDSKQEGESLDSEPN